jgi:hypothetical protein
VNYARTVVGYHGCDVRFARRLLSGTSRFKQSQNRYDWLGRGVYFWEYGADRAYEFAEFQIEHGRVQKPAVVGALLQLGRCFDLLDTRFTADLREAYEPFKRAMRSAGRPVPQNIGPTPDRKLRFRDCAVLNWYLEQLEDAGTFYDTVRCAFREGPPVFARSGIHYETHIQIAVRNEACILGVFAPTMSR